MRTKLLVAGLVVSLLLNVAGLVFFICFLNVQSSYKKVRKERNQMAQNLNVIKGAGLTSSVTTENDRIVKRLFASHVDGVQDYFAFIPPQIHPENLNNTLVVYLHGMGSNLMEPFIYPQTGQSIADIILTKDASAGFLSVSYRKEASWGNDLAISDINQNIREVMQQYPFSRIVLVGTSMGGCTASLYSAVAPPDIKDKIIGVVNIEGAGDLVKLFKRSKIVRMAMIMAFIGTPEQVPHVYQQKSFLSHIGELSPKVKYFVASAREDKIVPPELQKEIVSQLEKAHIPVKLQELEGGHGVPEGSVYADGYDFATH